MPASATLNAERWPARRRVFAPLANRLGIWQIKWELEDLVPLPGARDLQTTAGPRRDAASVSNGIEAARPAVQTDLKAQGLKAEVQGRPKHSTASGRRCGQGWTSRPVFDQSALRVIVADVPTATPRWRACTSVFTPVPGEFDDYIARPKPNGYQSLHTVVRDAAGKAMEVQIRTRAMHEHAEHGVAAHWAYKEAGARG